MVMMPSSTDLISGSPSPLHQPRNIGFTGGARTPIGTEAVMRPVSTFDFQRGNSGPDDMMIVEAIQNCLREVDLDNVSLNFLALCFLLQLVYSLRRLSGE
jgi:chitin synthase